MSALLETLGEDWGKLIMFIIDGENRNDLEAELSDNPWLRGRVEYFNNNGTTGKVMAG